MTARKIPDIIKEAVRSLRKNMTDAEKVLWEILRAERFESKKFLRQYPVFVFTEDTWLDRYVIPDFICKKSKIIIELDWSIHNIEEVYLLDREKEKLLEQIWYKVLRFRNDEISNDRENVLEKIAASFS